MTQAELIMKAQAMANAQYNDAFTGAPSEPSPEVRPARPTVVEVGQRYCQRGYGGDDENNADADCFVITSLDDPRVGMASFTWAGDGSEGAWETVRIPVDFKLLAPAPTTPEAPRGWEPGMPNLPKPPLGPVPKFDYACRLGAACLEHNKPVREPWVPSVSFEDLLPDA